MLRGLGHPALQWVHSAEIRQWLSVKEAQPGSQGRACIPHREHMGSGALRLCLIQPMPSAYSSLGPTQAPRDSETNEIHSLFSGSSLSIQENKYEMAKSHYGSYHKGTYVTGGGSVWVESEGSTRLQGRPGASQAGGTAHAKAKGHHRAQRLHLLEAACVVRLGITRQGPVKG